MKKKLKLLLACFAAFGLMGAAAACGGTETPDTPDTPPSPEAPATFTIKFVNFDGTEISSAEYEAGETVTVPADPTRAADAEYTYEFAGWDNDVVEVSGAATYTATYTKTAIEYTVIFMADGVAVSDAIPYSADSKDVTAPAVPEKAGYTGAWEAYTLTSGNVMINAVYTPIAYTATFKADGAQVGEPVSFTVEDKEIVAPAVPEKVGYTGVWSEYKITAQNIEIEAVYTVVNYKVTFKADGQQVGEVLSYNVENKTIAEPAVPSKNGYTGAWEAYTLTTGDVEIKAVYTAIEYVVTFKNGETIVDEVKFTIENGADKQAPAAPEKVGYTGVWTGYDFSKLENQEATPSFTANTYTITYKAAGGTIATETQSVTYDAEFALALATAPKSYQEFLGWVDEEGNKMSAGVWNLAKDITLTASYSEGVTFEALETVPTYMTKANDAGTLSIVNTTATDGNNCLAIPVTGGAPSLKVTMAFLDEMFADPNVDCIAFDAKTLQTETGNFRRYTLRTTGALGNECYEIDQQAYNCGIKTTWKTFYFLRSDYNVWKENDLETKGSNYFIITGNFTTGDTLYVDNIRPATRNDMYGFEGGGLRWRGAADNYVAYCYTPTYIGNWSLALTGGVLTDVKITNTNVSEGRTALEFTKSAGQTNFYVPKARMMLEDITATGYIAFDMYIPEGSDVKVALAGGATKYDGVPLVKGGWNTFYTMPGTAETIVTLTDTTGGTYVLDNIRSVSKADFDAAVLGFEQSGGGLRTDGLPGVFYYYGTIDHAASTYTLAVSNSGGTVAISNPRFDTEIVHSGTSSLAFEKENGYMTMTLKTDSKYGYPTLKNGFTMWIYSTNTLNGISANNFINGHNNKFGENQEGISIAPNKWTQITITADDINASGRFLIIAGSTAGTIYIDDIRPL